MTKNLSSRLTFIYKIIVPTIWTLGILSCIVVAIWDTKNLIWLVFLILVTPILIFVKLEKITYDNKYVYLSNYLTSWTYELKDIKSIRKRDTLSFDPLFFQLLIFEQNGEIRKVKFMPKVFEMMTYIFTAKLNGRLLELREKITAAKEAREIE